MGVTLEEMRARLAKKPPEPDPIDVTANRLVKILSMSRFVSTDKNTRVLFFPSWDLFASL